MKKLLFFLILALILCGCSKEPPTPTEPEPTLETMAPTQATEETAPPTEPEPEPVPLMTFDFRHHVTSMAIFGEGFVTTSENAEGRSFLSYYADPTAAPMISPEEYLFPDLTADTTVVYENRLAFIDWDQLEYIVVDENMEEVDRYLFPADQTGIPHITPDLSTIYFGTSDSLSKLDTATKEITRIADVYDENGDVSVNALLFDGHTVQVYADGFNYYYDGRTGQLLASDLGTPANGSFGDWLFVTDYDGYTQYLLRSVDGQQLRQFYPLGDGYLIQHFGCDGILHVEEDSTVLMDYYTLPQGKRVATMELPFGAATSGYALSDDLIWVWDNGEHVLYRWDLTCSDPKDSAVYVDKHYTADDPDLAGLAQIEEEAAQISEEFGVEVLVWDQIEKLDIWDYDLSAEWQVPPFRRSLKVVREVLSAFPEGLLKTASQSDDPITIALVHGIYGKEDNTLDSAGGLHIRLDDRPVIASTMESSLSFNLFHELEHMMDDYLFGQTPYLDDWNELNPDGFTYSYQYTDYWENEVDDYVYGENRYFVDSYSATYPSEDRARIFEYATQEDCGYVFESEHMQDKLSTLCMAIRNAFDLHDMAQPYIWEQYLTAAG